MANRWLVPVNSAGAGWRGDLGGGLGVFFAFFLVLGVELGGVGDEPVGDDRAEGAVGALGELFVDPAGGVQGESTGLGGDPAGLPGGHLQGLDPPVRSSGIRWCRSRASPISAAPARGVRPDGRGRRSRG